MIETAKYIIIRLHPHFLRLSAFHQNGIFVSPMQPFFKQKRLAFVPVCEVDNYYYYLKNDASLLLELMIQSTITY